MELDDLKQTWNKTQINIPVNQNIMEIIQHKNAGPVAALKKAFRNQMLIMSLLPVLLLLTNLDDVRGVLTNILFISYTVFCIMAVLFSYVNYLDVRKMQHMDEMVKPHLEEQINILEKRLRWNIIGLRIVLLYFIILLEVIPYFQHQRILDYWHSLNPVLRFSTYAIFAVMQYFASRKVSQRKFGNHLAYLKQLVNEM